MPRRDPPPTDADSAAEALHSQNFASGGGYGSTRDYGYQPADLLGSGSPSRASRFDYLRGTWGAGAPAGYVPSQFALRPRGSRHYRRTDARIREAIYETVIARRDVDAEHLDVEVRDGVVRLGGCVPERWMKHAIEDIAYACYGVRDVDNRIRLAGLSDEAITERP